MNIARLERKIDKFFKAVSPFVAMLIIAFLSYQLLRFVIYRITL